MTDIASAALQRFATVSAAALDPSSLDDLVAALSDALHELGLAAPGGGSRSHILREATRLTLHRMASGAADASEISRLRRALIILCPDARRNEAAAEAWISLAAAGAAALRRAYLASLLAHSRGLAGGNVVAVSDLTGEAVPVQAAGRGNRDTVTERVSSTAAQVLQSAVAACRAQGVAGHGRFAMSRIDRPSHTVFHGVLDGRVSPTGLPALVVHAVAPDQLAPMAHEHGPQPAAGAEALLALRVAG